MALPTRTACPGCIFKSRTVPFCLFNKLSTATRSLIGVNGALEDCCAPATAAVDPAREDEDPAARTPAPSVDAVVGCFILSVDARAFGAAVLGTDSGPAISDD